MSTTRLLTFVLICLPLVAQAQLTLETCKQKAHDNYPAVKEYALIDASRDYTLDNADKAWLPQVSVNGTGLAMTDLLTNNQQMKALGMDTKNLMASASLMVNQKIYDGGQTAASKAVTRAETEVNRRNLDVNMYAINSRIEQLYFGILLLDEQLKQNQLLHDDLSINERQVADMIKGGIANASDLDAVRVEVVRCEQNKASLSASRAAYLRMLGYFIGESLPETTTLQSVDTALSATDADTVARPELLWYDAQQTLISQQRKRLDTRLLPTVGAFGLGQAHSSLTSPTLLHNTFFSAGINISWNIGALYTRKNDLKKLQVESDRIEAERRTFLFNNRLQRDDAQGQIESLRRQLELDDKVVSLRRSIYDKSMKKVRLGTETVNEMLRDAIAVSQASQQQNLHRIQLQQAIYQQKTILGL